MGIGDRLLDPTFNPTDTQPSQQSDITLPYFKKVIKCPVKFTDDIIKYVESKEFLGMTLRPLQRKFLENLFTTDSQGNPKYEQGVFCAGMRGGKCLKLYTQILMYDGTLKYIQDLKVGDLVMGPDSFARTVLSTSRGESELFEIKQSCADTYIVNDYHILSLKKSQSIKNERHYYVTKKGEKKTCLSNGYYSNEPDVVNISIKNYINKPKRWKRAFFGWKPHTPFEFREEYKLPKGIDPYLCGLWLADGRKEKLSFSVNNKDIEIIDYIKEYTEKNKRRLSFTNIQKNSKDMNILCKTNESTHQYLDYFKEIGIYANKHVPECWQKLSIDNRYLLLAGYLDGDGYVSNGNAKVFGVASANKELLLGIKRLCDLLGFHVSYKKRNRDDKRTLKTYTSYEIRIGGDLSKIPTKLSRKKLSSYRKYDDNLSSIKVTPIGWGEYAGIGVDKDNLFCLADGTVIHNSWSAGFIVTYMTQYMLQFDQPALEFRQALGTRLTAQCIASSEEQSQETVFAAVESIFDYSAYWRKYISYLLERETTEGKFALYQDLKLTREFPEKNLAVMSLHSNSAALAGKTSYCVVLDELSRFDVVEGAVQAKTQKRTANAVYSTVSRACASLKRISKMVVVSSPMFEDDYTMQLLYMAKDCYVGSQAPVINALRSRVVEKVPNIYAMHATTFELNPKTKDNPDGYVEGIDFESERIQNPETFRRDYLAVPPATVNPFFEFPERIDRIIVEREPLVAFTDKMIEEDLMTENGLVRRMYIGKTALPLVQDRMKKYYICVDQGEKRDHFTLSMGHVEEIPIQIDSNQKEVTRLKVIIDILIGWIPDAENRITVSFANVEEVIKLLCSYYNIGKVGYDTWSSVESIQRLFSEGVYVEQIGATLEMYEVLKQLMYQGQVELPRQYPSHEKVVKELKQLTLIRGKKLDHPPQGSKDYADSIVRVVWFCYNDYILQTVHGQHMLPHKMSLPTLKSIASSAEYMKQTETNQYSAIWESGGGLGYSGAGVFGESFVVHQNVVPNVKKNK